ncbi:purine-nucleoside phosphorylase [Rhizobium sp. BK376]|uniref:purine-nucleoside phosphorylase n=1 Tax=Rhizobium sp. BK376 TaxID=2512149 RepID=UPI0010502FEE|nr:purine-nucleoside phosphorylase [Rhizobium sp. BK376]TCR90660.1 purine-nucleoside phosphorylase [Rhizobium sp. BK376]
MTDAVDLLTERLGPLSPRHGIVLGSGLGSLVAELADAVRIPYSELQDFPVSAVSGHAGELVAGRLGDVPVVMLSGRVHYYEKGDANAMRVPIETLKGLGVEKLILTNSAGSLREEMPPGSVMQITDHINYSGMNPLIGAHSDNRFVGMTNAYDSEMSMAMRRAAEAAGVGLFHGVYMWFSGPSFETPAEIRMARILGADAVGMSTVPEVILARLFGLRVAAASVITNYGAGMTGNELTHEETKDMAPVGGARLAAILKKMIADGGSE